MDGQVLGRVADRGAGGPCELELVRFFYRHPRAYITTDRLVSSVGYTATDVDAGVEALVRAGFVVRRPGALPGVAMYRLVVSLATERLTAVLHLVSIPRGRRRLQRSLRQQKLVRQARAARARAAILIQRGQIAFKEAERLLLAVRLQRTEGRRLADEARAP